MMIELLLLLLPVAAASGWMAAKQHHQKNIQNEPIPKDYFTGLNFLLNEQPDKAVEVFIKLLEVNADTVETHLALGHLFRKQGEVDRAIRIHQNLIARPQLTKAQRNQALFALAKDYFSAGVLDRSERLFLDAFDENNRDLDSLQHLLDIYQQEKSWEQAIEIAKKLTALTGKSQHVEIAHYYCELAEKALHTKELGQARHLLKQALASDKHNARALLLKAKIEASLQDYQTAIHTLESIKENNPAYFSETIPLLVIYHQQSNKRYDLFSFLEKSLVDCPRISTALVLTQQLQQSHPERAYLFLKNYLTAHPSLRGLYALLELASQLPTQNNASCAQADEKIPLIQTLLAPTLLNHPIYLCQHCGFSGKTLLWLCPSCKQWNVIKPILGLEGE
ncbi:MAG: lipopolysaccharide assembly protein LapB [Gammaproteobacteria bacterium]|nr:lipopolysaccharide assembly protein LapB [Gammaproteobacteria bacterium]